jgi:galactonate dehydratase
MAEAHYAHLVPHLYAGPIEAAANIQLDVCSPNFLIQEGIKTFDGFFHDLLKDPIEWQDGYIIQSSRPGIGYEINEAVADAHPYAKDSVFPYMEARPTPSEG